MDEKSAFRLMESFVLISLYCIQFSFKGKYFNARCSKHLVKSHLMAGEITMDIESYTDIRKCRPSKANNSCILCSGKNKKRENQKD